MKYDLMVIGGGTGGTRLSLSAASKGHKTVLIEQGVLGGTCLNTGCIPTKAMLYASHLYKLSKEMKEFGIDAKAKINFKKLMERVRSFSKIGQEHIYKSVEENKNLTLVEGKASFVDKNTVKVNNKKISADKLVIATGAKNFIPPIEGLDKVDYLDNVSLIYKLDKLPKSIIMVGGGYISMEFATFLNDLGTKVIVLERLPHILNMLDEDVVQLVYDSCKERGMDIKTNINILKAEEKGKKVQVIYDDVRDKHSKKETISADKILVATGRVPNTEGLDLEKAGVKTDKRGGIIVNDYLETSQKNIYAIGDVTGKALFAHAVKRETYLLQDTMFEKKKKKMPFSLIPWVAFAEPTIAGIGLNEEEAKKENDIYIMKAPFKKTGRASIINKTEGFVKVICNKKNDKILGVQIVGPHADDIIHEFVAVINDSGKIDPILESIHVHPTLSEVLEELSVVE